MAWKRGYHCTLAGRWVAARLAHIQHVMGDLFVCAAHPETLYRGDTVRLLSAIAGVEVVAVAPPANAVSLEEIVDAIEAERTSRNIGRWVFWGMSGGSFLGQLYARRHPDALLGVILASSGPYFRPTVEDPDCILSPRHPAWIDKLAAAGLLVGEYESGPTEWQQVETVGWVFRRANGAALVVSPDAPTPALQRIMPALWDFDARKWLTAISVPALVMCGTADPIVPIAHAARLASLLPNVAYCPIAGEGHIPLRDDRGEVERAVRGFLERLLS